MRKYILLGREALKVASAIMPELQLDGGGDTITDSSSEEDEVSEIEGV